MVMTIPAIKRGYCVMWAPWKTISPRCSGINFFDDSTSIASKYSFHTARMLKIASTAMAGRASGSAMCQ